jgi:hypothetical protein
MWLQQWRIAGSMQLDTHVVKRTIEAYDRCGRILNGSERELLVSRGAPQAEALPTERAGMYLATFRRSRRDHQRKPGLSPLDETHRRGHMASAKIVRTTITTVRYIIPGCALHHGLEIQKVLGRLAGGTTLMLLRLHTDALWMPVGYHWAWNVLQTAVFGASDAAPSILPLQVHGPERWMGKPGQPEPGLFSTLVHLAVTLLLWLWMRRSGMWHG